MRRPRVSGKRGLRSREALASRPPALRPAHNYLRAARGGDEGAVATAPDQGPSTGPSPPGSAVQGVSTRTPPVERREAPFPDRKGKGDAFPEGVSSGGLAGRPGSLASSRVSRRSAPLEGAEMWTADEGLPGADRKNTGDESCLARTTAEISSSHAHQERFSMQPIEYADASPAVRAV